MSLDPGRCRRQMQAPRDYGEIQVVVTEKGVTLRALHRTLPHAGGCTSRPGGGAALGKGATFSSAFLFQHCDAAVTA